MIVFLRHFYTENNLKGIVTGQLESNIIDSTIKNIDCFYRVDLIISSPSERCKKTLENLLSSNRKNILLKYDSRLLERDLGIFEGKAKIDLLNNYPEFFFKTENEILFNPLLTPPDGEAFSDFSERIYNFYLNYLKDNTQTILICSHNQTLKRLFFYIKNECFLLERWIDLKFGNGKLTIV